MSQIIAAVSTGNVVSAIGIIRMTGAGCAAVADKVFTRMNGKSLAEAPERKLVLGDLHDSQGRVIYARDSALTLQYYGTLNLGDGHGNVYDHQYYYEYAADGRISKITHRDFQTVVSTITPTYDEAGKLKRLQAQIDARNDGLEIVDLFADERLHTRQRNYGVLRAVVAYRCVNCKRAERCKQKR